MRDDYDRDMWSAWASPAPAQVPPYPCQLCGVVVRGPADPAHDFEKHPTAA